jgi:hypothetical protein
MANLALGNPIARNKLDGSTFRSNRSIILKALRLYPCSSPIVCLADAISMILQWVVTMYHLKVPLGPATVAVVYKRADDMIKEIALEDLEEDQGRLGSTWPRWLFFISGGLPPAIKLASLSGV